VLLNRAATGVAAGSSVSYQMAGRFSTDSPYLPRPKHQLILIWRDHALMKQCSNGLKQSSEGLKNKENEEFSLPFVRAVIFYG